jgi:hypothetical protein
LNKHGIDIEQIIEKLRLRDPQLIIPTFNSETPKIKPAVSGPFNKF